MPELEGDGRSGYALPFPFSAMADSKSDAAIIGAPFRPKAIVQTDVTIIREQNKNKLGQTDSSASFNAIAAAAALGHKQGLKGGANKKRKLKLKLKPRAFTRENRKKPLKRKSLRRI